MTLLDTFESHRPLLFSIAYRMLGSAMEAEDMVQETFVRYQAADEADIRAPKAYLCTIITRLCLDQIKSARARREQYVGMWLPEPLHTDDAPAALHSRHESIALAFLVLLESLSPIERAVYLLREVFDFPYSDIARIVDKSEENCRRYHHRARQFLVERRPRFEPAQADHQALVNSFLQAVGEGDLDGLMSILSQDVVMQGDGGGKVPSVTRPLLGRDPVARFMIGIYRKLQKDPVASAATTQVTELNGAPALVVRVGGMPIFAVCLSIADGKIQAIHNILNPDKLQGLV